MFSGHGRCRQSPDSARVLAPRPGDALSPRIPASRTSYTAAASRHRPSAHPIRQSRRVSAETRGECGRICTSIGSRIGRIRRRVCRCGSRGALGHCRQAAGGASIQFRRERTTVRIRRHEAALLALIGRGHPRDHSYSDGLCSTRARGRRRWISSSLLATRWSKALSTPIWPNAVE
jgi:hypothetical protein